MQILDQCTLLQAAEYIAFGWEPLSKEEDFTEKRSRYYMLSDVDEKYNDILDEQLFALSKAKVTLFMLIDKGLMIIDEKGKPITIDKEHVVEHDFANLHLGLEYEPTFIDEDNGFIDYPYIVIESNPDKVIEINKNPQVRFVDLKGALEQYKKKVPPVNHEYRLVLDDKILYLQMDNDISTQKNIHKFSDDANNAKIFKTIISDVSNKQITSDGTICYEHKDINPVLEEKYHDDPFSQALQSAIKIIRKNMDIFDAFFKVTSKKIVYRPIVNDSFLYKNGLPIPKF